MKAAKRMVKEAAYAGFPTTLSKSYSSLKFSDLVDDLETTDRLTVSASFAVQRNDVVIEV